MELLGLKLSQFLIGLGLTGVGVVLFYILKLRRETYKVPFIKLWYEIYKEKEAQSLWARVKHPFSLILNLILIWLLVTAIGDPRPYSLLKSGINYIVVIDTSISMATEEPSYSKTRIELGIEQVKRLIDRVSTQDQILIMEYSVTPEIVVPFTSNREELLNGLKKIQVKDTTGDLYSALNLCSSLIADKKEWQVIIVSDGCSIERDDPRFIYLKPLLNSGRVYWIKIGSKLPNSSVTGFSVRKSLVEPTKNELFMKVTGDYYNGEEEELFAVSFYNDGVYEPGDIFQLKKKGTKNFVSFITGNINQIKVEVRPLQKMKGCSHDKECGEGERCLTVKPNYYYCTTKEPLMRDNYAYSVVSKKSLIKIALLSQRTNLYLVAALLLEPNWEVEKLDPSTITEEQLKDFDVIIFDGSADIKVEKGNVIYLNPIGTGAPFKITGMSEPDPPWGKIDSAHPITKFLKLKDVHTKNIVKVEVEKGDKVLAYTYNGLPAIVTGRRGEMKFISLNFDPLYSDFVLRIGWPLFIINSVYWLIGSPKQLILSFPTGENLKIEVDSEEDKLYLINPQGSTQPLINKDKTVYITPLIAGFYKITDKKGYQFEFAVNYMGKEISLNPPSKLLKGDFKIKEFELPKKRVSRTPYLYLLLLFLMLSLFEYYTYHRRLTV